MKLFLVLVLLVLFNSYGVLKSFLMSLDVVSIGLVFFFDFMIGKVVKVVMEVVLDDVNINLDVFGGIKFKLTLYDSNFIELLEMSKGKFFMMFNVIYFVMWIFMNVSFMYFFYLGSKKKMFYNFMLICILSLLSCLMIMVIRFMEMEIVVMIGF